MGAKKSSGIDGVTSSQQTPLKLANIPTECLVTVDSISFGGVPVEDFEVISEDVIRLVTPAHSAGKVDVNIRSISGDIFTYSDGYEYIDTTEPSLPNTETPSSEIEAPNTGYRKN